MLNELYANGQTDAGEVNTGYDALGRVAWTEDALNRRTEFVYDLVGNQIQVFRRSIQTFMSGDTILRIRPPRHARVPGSRACR